MTIYPLAFPLLPGAMAWTPGPEGFKMVRIDADGLILGRPADPRAVLALEDAETRRMFDAVLVEKHLGPSTRPAVVCLPEHGGWLLTDLARSASAFVPMVGAEPIGARKLLWMSPADPLLAGDTALLRAQVEVLTAALQAAELATAAAKAESTRIMDAYTSSAAWAEEVEKSKATPPEVVTPTEVPRTETEPSPSEAPPPSTASGAARSRRK